MFPWCGTDCGTDSWDKFPLIKTEKVRRFGMTEKNTGASLSILAGVVILIWWFSSEFGFPGLFNDCWIGGFCLILMIPGAIGLILITAGFWHILRGNDKT